MTIKLSQNPFCKPHNISLSRPVSLAIISYRRVLHDWGGKEKRIEMALGSANQECLPLNHPELLSWAQHVSAHPWNYPSFFTVQLNVNISSPLKYFLTWTPQTTKTDLPALFLACTSILFEDGATSPSLASITESGSASMYWVNEVTKQGMEFRSFQFQSSCSTH